MNVLRSTISTVFRLPLTRTSILRPKGLLLSFTRTPLSIITMSHKPAFTGSANMSTKTFDSLQNEKVDSRILKAIREDMKFTNMSEVQEVTLPHLLTGADILAQAKTGTGKTLAFLIPAIQRIVNFQVSSGGITTLIISPTRELAQQIADEAIRLTSYMKQVRVQIAVGGNSKDKEARGIANAVPHILVATPGRLLDHLNDEHMRSLFSGLQTLILDEADRLLDQGFKRDIDQIVARLPNRAQTPRQTLLFSATVGPDVKEVAKKTLNPNYTFISTVSPDEANSHAKIPQHLITLPNEDPSTFLPVCLALLLQEREAAGSSFKAMVFLPTARQTGMFAAMFAHPDLQSNFPEVFEIHSRKSQPQRSKAAAAFSSASSALMFSSDVTARGMDFPNVTHVFQFGIPTDGEQYIHRLGRTGRAGKSGAGYTVLYPFEKRVFKTYSNLKAMPIADTPPPAVTPQIQSLSDAAIQAVDPESLGQAYLAWMGFYKVFLKKMGWLPANMTDFAARMALEAWGLDEVPTIFKQTVGKMGLKGVPGLNIVNKPMITHGQSGGGRGGASNGTRGGRAPQKRLRNDGEEKPAQQPSRRLRHQQ